MKTALQSSNCFERLRRERRLFAFVGTLLLLLAAMQPLAYAAAGVSGDWTICRGLSGHEPDGNQKTPERDCPACCLTGICAAASAPAKAVVAGGPIFVGPTLAAGPQFDLALARAVHPTAGPPPPIRAPPDLV